MRYGVGLTSLLEGDHEAAEQALFEALTEARSTGQRSLEAYALLTTAIARAQRAPDRTAAQLLGAALSMFESNGELPERTEAALQQRALAAAPRPAWVRL